MLVHRALCAVAFIALAATPVAQVLAQEVQEGPAKTTALINAESKSNEPLNPAMLKLEVNGRLTPLDNVVAVHSSTAQLAILIDDGLRGSFGLQLKEVQKFITELPPGMEVLVGYMHNGKVDSAGGFSTSHVETAAALRITMSSPGISGSPYFCLSDFVKHWPSNERAARFVLMLTNGVDPYNGSTSILNQDSPYVEAAQHDAQRAGVAVYSIYFGNAGIGGRRADFSGQSYLQQVADATGGQSYYQGTGNPVNLAPYLKQFRSSLMESYNITFQAKANQEKPDTLVRMKLKTTQPGVKIHAPEAVRPGAVE